MASAQYQTTDKRASDLLGERLFPPDLHSVQKRKTCESYDVCLGKKAEAAHGISPGDRLSVITMSDSIVLLPERSTVENELITESVLDKKKERKARKNGLWSLSCNLTSIAASYHSLEDVTHVMLTIHDHGIRLKPVDIERAVA